MKHDRLLKYVFKIQMTICKKSADAIWKVKEM